MMTGPITFVCVGAYGGEKDKLREYLKSQEHIEILLEVGVGVYNFVLKVESGTLGENNSIITYRLQKNNFVGSILVLEEKMDWMK